MSQSPRVYAMEPMFGTGRDEMVQHVPHAVRLGIKVVELDRCTATLKLPWSEDKFRHEVGVEPSARMLALVTRMQHPAGQERCA